MALDATEQQTADTGLVIFRASRLEALLEPLQLRLAEVAHWVQHTGRRVVVILEGRDTAGKGGVIRRMTYELNPRYCRVVAHPAPTERQRPQW